jgi:hypothetical protein
MNIEYVDDEELENEVKQKEKSSQKNDEVTPLYVTNTKNYNSNEFEIITPEEVERFHKLDEINNPNPEFKEAIKNIENVTNRQLTKEEYFKAADVYATILAERDEERKKNYEGKYVINPIKKEKYFQLILENKPVNTAMRELVRDYENSKLEDIEKAMEDAQTEDIGFLELKENKRINIHYKGKCRIASDQGGKVIVIDNKNDVDLLRMKYRKEWIDKKFPDTVEKAQIRIREEDGEFI